MRLTNLMELQTFKSSDNSIINVMSELKIIQTYNSIIKSPYPDTPKNRKIYLKVAGSFIQLSGHYSILTQEFFASKLKAKDGNIDGLVTYLKRNPDMLEKVKNSKDFIDSKLDNFTKQLDKLNTSLPKAFKNAKNSLKPNAKIWVNDFIIMQQAFSKIPEILKMFKTVLDKMEIAINFASDINHKYSGSAARLLDSLKDTNLKNSTKIYLAEKEMLDISIQNADKVATNDTKIKAFLSDDYKVEEKFDGCLDYNTLVETLEFGILPLGKIVEDKIECRVKSFDIENNEVLYEFILGFSVEENKDNWYEIVLENGKKLIVTENHYIWMADLKCWRQVKDLMVDDNLLLDTNI